MKALINRMFRAIKLDRQLFEEIVSDPSVQGQSVWAVAIFAMATAFGSFTMIGGTAVNIGLITTMIAWYVWAFSLFYIGTRFLGEHAAHANRKTIMRVVAFGCAPGIFRLLGIIPKTATIVLIITSLWILATVIIGLKSVFSEAHSAKIAIITVVTWIAATLFQLILIVTLLSVFGVSKSAS